MIINKRPPYANTTVDPSKTQAQIGRLLTDYGITRFMWDNDFAHSKIMLLVEIEQEREGAIRKYHLKIQPPLFLKERRTWNPMSGKSEKVISPNYAQSFRLLYNDLKVKLEMISYGGVSIESEFLAQILTKLPTGRTATFEELVQSTPDLLQLPDNTELRA